MLQTSGVVDQFFGGERIMANVPNHMAGGMAGLPSRRVSDEDVIIRHEPEPIEAWRRAWRAIAQQISTRALRALQKALENDNKQLLQGQTTSPPSLQAVQDWPIEAVAKSANEWSATRTNAAGNCLARPEPVFQGKIEGSPLHMPIIGPSRRKKPLISGEKLGVDALNNYTALLIALLRCGFWECSDDKSPAAETRIPTPRQIARIRRKMEASRQALQAEMAAATWQVSASPEACDRCPTANCAIDAGDRWVLGQTCMSAGVISHEGRSLRGQEAEAAFARAIDDSTKAIQLHRRARRRLKALEGE
jgi:hypothetical protein